MDAARAHAARAHLERIAARPRAAGSDEERAARAYCAERLRALGFTVREEPFEYSAAPGRAGTPLAGLCAIVMVGAAAVAGARGDAAVALGILCAGAVLVAMAAALLARRGVTDLPVMRATGVNLVAVRGAPRVWLVAHLDSKSQPIPIAVRALGVMGSIGVWVLAACTALAQWRGVGVASWWPVLAVLAVVAGAPVAASVVRNRSPGALDDASGVATVLLAAERVGAAHPLGVLLTSAEELGLAGSRAWARHMAPGTAINVDGVDDTGGMRLIWSRRRPAWLLSALSRAAAAEGVAASSSRLVPGVLLDGVALADAGWDVATVSRGSWRTVARIHTAHDDLRSLSGAGASLAASVVARALEEVA
ncbi:MAG TPA: M28 family peptidase [Gemmatimonadaceae bacterium]|nr:M28 family peptidase [Gemmatimonadaceae bacterium]